ncbi:MAG TPA: YifB family Mg chelatase-like AAA ATPase [Verrucomicrobiae bacterium]|nr:YifB family Mg chelatase-like AAA ATPase [Verrucomicrobiae bacterium]
MGATVKSILDAGNQAVLIDVECHVSNGLPTILIVGFANKAVDESKERIRGAFSSAKLELPRKRIIINLAPADVPKNSTSFDLPMVASILLASGQVAQPIPHTTALIGELGLDGNIRAVRGIIGKLLGGRQKGLKTFYIPRDNLQQAMLVPGLELVPVATVRELYLDLTDTVSLKRVQSGAKILATDKTNVHSIDFGDVVGQARAKRALEIAAAGGHNIFMNGAPGSGKSMLAKALPTILPDMTTEEMLETTHVHSLTSKEYEQIITQRPFRSPHHSSSMISIMGGGQNPRPGEISLAHNGVLFFDEFPEFNRAVLEGLRQPLEDRKVSIARARDTVEFPAHFVLVATSNPCPCGYYGSSKTCICPPYQIAKYRQKVSGPIIDRIDLYIDVDEVKHEQLLRDSSQESSSSIQKRVAKARKRQLDRYRSVSKQNATLTNRDIKGFLTIQPEAEELLNRAAQKLDISARSYMKILKVAQTIADLSAQSSIQPEHVSEALQYRRPSNQTF